MTQARRVRMMTYDDDITDWLKQLKAGDEQAAQVIWENYFSKLVRLARRRLEGMPRRVVDEEDVALSAINSFCRRASDGQFPQLNDRHDLWKLLVTITARKAIAQHKRHHAQKRGGGQVRGESIFVGRQDDTDARGGIEEALGTEPTPELAAKVAETIEKLMASLEDGVFRQVATMKMEGYQNEEIAEHLGVTTRTVERKLNRIREKWASSAAELIGHDDDEAD